MLGCCSNYCFALFYPIC